jgi:hypothetical protein
MPQGKVGHGDRQLHVDIFNDNWGTTMSSNPEIEEAKLQSLDKKVRVEARKAQEQEPHEDNSRSVARQAPQEQSAVEHVDTKQCSSDNFNKVNLTFDNSDLKLVELDDDWEILRSISNQTCPTNLQF